MRKNVIVYKEKDRKYTGNSRQKEEIEREPSMDTKTAVGGTNNHVRKTYNLTYSRLLYQSSHCVQASLGYTVLSYLVEIHATTVILYYLKGTSKNFAQQ